MNTMFKEKLVFFSHFYVEFINLNHFCRIILVSVRLGFHHLGSKKMLIIQACWKSRNPLETWLNEWDIRCIRIYTACIALASALLLLLLLFLLLVRIILGVLHTALIIIRMVWRLINCIEGKVIRPLHACWIAHSSDLLLELDNI